MIYKTIKFKTNPKTTDDMIFSSKTVKTKIENILNHTQPFPIAGVNSLLFYGSYGTGKSTYAEIFINEFEKSYGGSNPYIEIVNCQKTENISTIIKRCDQISNYVSWNSSSYHYFIFDEVDNFTNDAQRALKSFLNKKNIICVLTTNFLNKIDNGVRSRCVLVNFNASNELDYVDRLKQILNANRLPLLPDYVLDEIVRISNGDWREMTPLLLEVAINYKQMNPAA